MSLNIVLVEPEIPQNTGNIIRSCAATGTTLHLVRPLGFCMDDKYLKRAGLDYWDLVEIKYYDSFDEVREQNPDAKFFYSTTKAKQTHSDVKYEENSFIVFGKETKGLPESLIMDNLETAIRIPMVDIEKARSLNLSNSVAIVLFEALRQIGYPNLR
ncbi:MULTISPECIES: tRNA (uridine(34)/cytosine(34)/5-carboxymethylaminomethyluridine(34)-2'-O)-methyltransferase TrmL [Paraclostridium]|jgi:tRNA (cytidine/uridine-2'-O-)-methyltransferase|uniref:Putative tRNA (cytidine(34)-2'-O)-methyltransferase n=3 Tax=Paraclostridium TaxID=1849822 RepID=A0A0M3DI86_9FIRM|nr:MULTISPECIES: tRNA (uridine(34)/cytosine(34)/5-carboxymethylaminomethyluridine(34)-2'-O)-methyltransferase TrmL [Paraclostridium]KGJ49278.1 tRNA methyltransferase [Clostridium sp. NCR]EQK44712.1 tRNA (cytidine(34)-2'-O)-methyltransferase [[Clostridium] bifermentans ATCC 638] [Paraclostridium bifermentans ATCC 638 = DSM 14991]KKY02305.1 tRNA methyltransferase [Paraclostridium benzoelyticum]MBN8048585.1 tRNA (uridine(34)/cytosine(34)/5-carboxymethylaminomethyluridine(34)-2'-O)-methyltransferas